MPKIKQDDAQEKALKSVNANLSAVQDINTALAADDAAFSVVVKKEGARAITIVLSDKSADKVKSALTAQRLALVKEINNLCGKYRIELDDSDLTIIK